MKIKIKLVNGNWLDEDGVVYTLLIVDGKPLFEGDYDCKHNHYTLYKIVEESFNDPVDGVYKIVKQLSRHTCKKLNALVALTLAQYRQDDVIGLLEERIQSLTYKLEELQTAFDQHLARSKRGGKKSESKD